MRKNHHRPALLLALTLGSGSALLSQLVQADVYRWIDAQGRVQYTDRPIPGAERVSTSTKLPGSDTAKTTAELERLKASGSQLQTQAAAAAKQETVQQDVAGARVEQCKQARERYDKSVRARRIFRTNEKGEREYLTDAEADAARVGAKSAVDEACGKS
jgi:Domain of unknown function (DUF4124)